MPVLLLWPHTALLHVPSPRAPSFPLVLHDELLLASHDVLLPLSHDALLLVSHTPLLLFSPNTLLPVSCDALLSVSPNTLLPLSHTPLLLLLLSLLPPMLLFVLLPVLLLASLSFVLFGTPFQHVVRPPMLVLSAPTVGPVQPFLSQLVLFSPFRPAQLRVFRFLGYSVSRVHHSDARAVPSLCLDVSA